MRLQKPIERAAWHAIDHVLVLVEAQTVLAVVRPADVDEDVRPEDPSNPPVRHPQHRVKVVVARDHDTRLQTVVCRLFTELDVLGDDDQVEEVVYDSEDACDCVGDRHNLQIAQTKSPLTVKSDLLLPRLKVVLISLKQSDLLLVLFQERYEDEDVEYHDHCF